MTIKPENSFAVSLKQWERNQFDVATHFNVVRFEGLGQRTMFKYKTFPEALAKARSPKENKADRDWMIYVVTKTGRHFCIDRAEYDYYLARWNDLHAKPKPRKR